MTQPNEIADTTKSASPAKLSSSNDKLDALERELQKQCHITVMLNAYSTFPTPKAYPAAQKETASKLYNLINEGHYQNLKLDHAERLYEDCIKALEIKWMLEVPHKSANDCNAKDDDVHDELAPWYRQMANYEKRYKEVMLQSSDSSRTGNNTHLPEQQQQLFGDIQLCYDVSYTVEGFQEILEFCTETNDHSLKITITYDGSEITAKSSMHMKHLKELVERCFNAKTFVNVLIREIWSLFDQTFIDSKHY